jgi:dynein light chain LC8-type
MKLKAIEFVKLRFTQQSRNHNITDVQLAKELKTQFDEQFHPTWQCIVGKHFGSQIGFEDKHMIYFYHGSTAVLLWRCG